MEYKYELDDEKVNLLTNRTNRSKAQTKFLFNLLKGDFKKLQLLEMKMKNCFVFYCPADDEAVNEILSMTDKITNNIFEVNKKEKELLSARFCWDNKNNKPYDCLMKEHTNVNCEWFEIFNEKCIITEKGLIILNKLKINNL